MAKKIEAWKAIDGKLFLKEVDAINYEVREKKVIYREIIFKDKLDEIKQHFKTQYDETSKENNEPLIPIEKIKPLYETDGWECNENGNPIGICIYDYQKQFYYGDDICGYCHDPDERK